ncbi:MAG: glycosyltransferase [Sulfuriferula sp.]|nr:glycosyltransferase [Sulfuriferula sp.]
MNITPDISILPSQALPANHPDANKLGFAMMHVLSSPDFLKLTASQQVAWILHCFQTAVTRYLPELAIIRSLVQFHSVHLYKDPALTLADACTLTESIMGLNWGDAASLFDMRGYDRYGMQPFRNYVRTHTTTPIGEKKTVIAGKKLKIIYFSHYAYTNADKVIANSLGPFIRDIMLSHASFGNAEIICYCVQWQDQAYIDVLTQRGISVRVIPQALAFDRLEELRMAILADAPDVLISDMPSPIASWLFIHRGAPLQVYLDPGYPHWNLPEIDWVLLPGKIYQHGFELPSKRWSTMRVALCDAALGIDTDMSPTQARMRTEDTIRFGVFARLTKITNAWISAAESLLTQLPNASLLIVGSGNPALLQHLLKHPDYAGRVSLINEMVDLKAHQNRIDIFLDTFPFIGGLVCREFMAYGVPIVSLLAGEWDEMLRDQRDPELLAQSLDEFVAIAWRLAADSEFYRTASLTAFRLAAKHNQPSAMVRDIEDGIRQAIDYHQCV